MAIIGFFVMILLGLYFAVHAIGGVMVSLGFTGKFPWAYFGIFAALSAAVFYYAFTHAPFVVSVATA